MTADYYQQLGLTPSASTDEVKEAYRRLVRLHHPDANPADRESAEFKIKSILAAYAVLSDPEKRGSYDLEYRAGGAVEASQFAPVTTPANASNVVVHASAPVSLLGRVRQAMGLSAEEMAHRLGMSLDSLGSMEARDSMPQGPVQLRTFTHMVEQAVEQLMSAGDETAAASLRASLGRKRMHRGNFR